jgi:aminopeptidase N
MCREERDLKKGSWLSYVFLFFILIPVVLQADFAGGETQMHPFPVYTLSVSFDLKNSILDGVVSLDLPEEKNWVISTGHLDVLSVELNGQSVDYKKGGERFEIQGKGTLVVRYKGIFRGEKGGGENPENIGVAGGMVSEQGISLTGTWYPSLGGLGYYHLKVLVPGSFSAVSEADEISVRRTPAGNEYSFLFPYPLDGVSLAAGDYKEVKASEDGIDVYAYFFPEDSALADTYIEYTKKYLRMYGALLVPYPYKRFSVVENILPTGYSMPTFTLLGKEVVRLPFIPETSLGHEITHQWFGNYVYADFDSGNWLEAITTYLSDHLYEEKQGRGWEYRKKILTDYQSYVTPEKDFPLRDFVARKDFASMAIGYGKGAMFFHMLKNLEGEEVFYRSLRRLIREYGHKKASWADIQRSFERESGQDLGWFFTQWLERKGVPDITAEDTRELVLQGVPTASFQTVQADEPFTFTLPVKIVETEGESKDEVRISKEKQYFDIEAKGGLRDLVFDGDYDVMRRLSPDEFPPVIARLLGDEKRLVVYPEKARDKYADLIDFFLREGFTSREETDVNDEDIGASSLLVLGYESPLLKRLFGGVRKPGPGFGFTVRNNPLNPSKVVAYADGDSKEEISLAAGKIIHYGKYSVLRFAQGRNVQKETSKTDRGMIFVLREGIEGVEPKKTQKLETIIEKVSDVPVIIVGERHTNYEDHKVELDVVMALHKKGKKFAIGMEMFQRPFQSAIDEYLSGAIDERQFLKKTEYFKRWSFDYNYYREIIEFARAKGIPIIALNARSEVVRKVAAGGLDALSENERRDIPEDMDMSDDDYRSRLREIYQSHPQGTQFENFYQSQILWDETMAHSVAGFLKEKPGYQMVVMAGAEHVMYDSGIPKRVGRLTGKEYTTLINGAFDAGIGNYVLFPDEISPPFTAKLGVLLEEKEGRLIVKGFAPGSIALDAGLEEGDVIVSIDGMKVETISDAKIALFDKRPEQTVKVGIKRKRFLFGERDMEFTVTF